MTSIGLRSDAIGPARGEAAAPGVVRGLVVASAVCAAVAGVIGLAAMCGWIFDVNGLKEILPGLGTMRFNTALAITLIAVAWFVPLRIGYVLDGLVEVIALLTLTEWIVGRNVGIDQLFIHDPSDSSHPGRIAVVTATGLALLATADLLPWRRRPRLSQACATLVLLLASVTLLGYAYNTRTLYSIRSLSTVALHTAVSLLLLSLAVLASIPDGALSWALSGVDAGATLVRRLVPVAFVVLPVIGLLFLLGERAGWFDSSATAALIVVACALVVGFVSWAAARRLARVDRGRAQAIRELTELRNDLERQVHDRASQLQRGRNHIAVLEDRQRIAADLHDIVIQRLFAAGMFLQSGGSAVNDPETRHRVDTAVEAMDTAIKDLRASIFELGGRMNAPSDLTTAVDDVCLESARVLGFVPDVIVDDPDLRAVHARDDILAVLREALANVARHAGATRVDVALRSHDGVVSLTVVDDGRGIVETTRRSGTRNMVERAREHGGDCTWTAIKPHGTMVHWFLPIRAGVEA